jgi:hypothetical protein
MYLRRVKCWVEADVRLRLSTLTNKNKVRRVREISGSTYVHAARLLLRSSLATLTASSWNQLLGCFKDLQRLNLGTTHVAA